MGFQDEMKQVFLRVAAGEIEPEEWGKWWNGNKVKLEEILTRGDRGRMMPAKLLLDGKDSKRRCLLFSCPGASDEDFRLLWGKSKGRGNP